MGEATASSSSGLAMRRPPSDCERLRSPDMLRGRSQCRWPAERRGGWRAGRGTSESCGGAWGGGCRQRLYSERGRCREEEVVLAAAARNSAAEQKQLWRRRRWRRRGGRSGGCCDVQGWSAMQCWVQWARRQCIAVYIRVDRRAQCDVVLTSMLLLLLLVLASNSSPVRFLPRALTACTQKHKHERFSASPAVQIAGPSIETQSTT